MRVIGSKVDGSREALLDGQLGRLVAPNVPEQLAKAISEVLCGGSSRERNSLVKCFDLRISGQGRRMVDGTDNKRSKPWGDGATAAFGRNVDDGSAQTLCCTQDVRVAERTNLFDNSTRWQHRLLRIPTNSRALEILPLVRGKRVPYNY